MRSNENAILVFIVILFLQKMFNINMQIISFSTCSMVKMQTLKIMTFYAKHHTNVSKTWDLEKMELHNLTNAIHFVYIANPSWNFLCKFKYMYWIIITKNRLKYYLVAIEVLIIYMHGAEGWCIHDLKFYSP